MKRLVPLFALLCLVSLSSGCGTTAANTIELSTDNEAQIRILNSSFADDIEISTGKASYINEIMEVVVTVESLDSERHAIEYLAKWFDRDGVVLNNTDQPWITEFVAAREIKQIRVVSPGPGAKSCRVLVRSGAQEK
jgi:uncharacterized protein YcfL